MNYGVDYFLNKFQAIPEDKWCIYTFRDKSKRCVNGHCGIRDTVYADPTKQSYGLYLLFQQLNDGRDRTDLKYSFVAAHINNGEDERYRQSTPKARILAALYDIKKSQYPELSETTVEDIISEKVL